MPQGTNVYAATLPSLATDGTTINQRTTQRGDLRTAQVMDSHSALAEGGACYRVCSDPTIVAASYPQASTATAFGVVRLIFVSIWNSSQSQPRHIYLDYLKLICTNMTTTNIGGGLSYSVRLYTNDVFSSTLSTGLGVTHTPVNTNTDFANNSVAVVRQGTMTLASGITGAGAPILSRGSWKRNNVVSPPGPIVGDIFVVDFGEHAAQANNMARTTASQYVSSSGPLVIGPRQFAYLEIGSTGTGSTAVGSYALEMGWWER